MTYINLTPRVVAVATGAWRANHPVPGWGLISIPPSGDVARCTATSLVGEVVGLPDPIEGTIFIVSALVRLAVPHRTDVASPGPGDLVRDAGGN
jgi:translation initiation factor 2 gamma subunit (eIF-2gamma)